MLIDLSIPLNNQTSAFPGDPHIEIRHTGDIKKLGYQGQRISLASHTGTHVDAPSHMIDGGKDLKDFSLDTFCGAARKFVVSGDKFDLSQDQIGNIEKNDIVLLQTNASKKLADENYFHTYPVMSANLAQKLVDCGVKMVGLDTPSADRGGTFDIHRELLGNNILIVENLINLDSVPSECVFYGFPIRLEADGAPLRAVAEVKI